MMGCVYMVLRYWRVARCGVGVQRPLPRFSVMEALGCVSDTGTARDTARWRLGAGRSHSAAHRGRRA